MNRRAILDDDAAPCLVLSVRPEGKGAISIDDGHVPLAKVETVHCALPSAFAGQSCVSCGRSNQSGGGGGGAATIAGGRGVSESRAVPGDRCLPGDFVSIVESPPRWRCSARMRTRPEPAKSTSGWPPTALNPTTVPWLPARTLISLARAATRSPTIHSPAASSWPSSIGFHVTLRPP